MTTREQTFAIISLAISLAGWAWLYNWHLSFVFITSILVHEYGHYWQMKREGIEKRSMLFLPFLGAIAISKEPWPSLKAKAQIALAGPFWGLFPSAFFFFLFQMNPSHLWLGGVFVSSALNLINLFPLVAVLDGGQAIGAILMSFGRKVTRAFYLVGFGLIFAFFLFLPFNYVLILLFLAFLLARDFQRWSSAPQLLAMITRGQELQNLINALPPELERLKTRLKEVLEVPLLSSSDESDLRKIANPVLLSKKQMLFYFGAYILVVLAHLSMLVFVSSQVEVRELLKTNLFSSRFSFQ